MLAAHFRTSSILPFAKDAVKAERAIRGGPAEPQQPQQAPPQQATGGELEEAHGEEEEMGESEGEEGGEELGGALPPGSHFPRALAVVRAFTDLSLSKAGNGVDPDLAAEFFEATGHVCTLNAEEALEGPFKYVQEMWPRVEAAEAEGRDRGRSRRKIF